MTKELHPTQDRSLKIFLAFLLLLPTLLRAAQKSGLKLIFPTQVNLVNFSPRANAWIGVPPGKQDKVSLRRVVGHSEKHS